MANKLHHEQLQRGPEAMKKACFIQGCDLWCRRDWFKSRGQPGAYGSDQSDCN